MRPRILLRTHYQADEPRTIIATVTECTSPTESHDEELVAERLVRWVRKTGEPDYALSKPGGIYAVGNARFLGLLDMSNRWTATGLAFAFIKSNYALTDAVSTRVLSVAEQRLYMSQYLENAGALLIKFGSWLVGHGRTTHVELRENAVLQTAMVDALDDYLTLATEVRDRTSIRRERDRLKRSDYAANTQRHKRYPLLTTMNRLGLIEQSAECGVQEIITPNGAGRLVALVSAVPDVATLEEFARHNKLRPTLHSMVRSPKESTPPAASDVEILTAAYRYAMEQGLQACPLRLLDDVLYATAPPDTRLSGGFTSERLLDGAHRKRPSDVRFHVDRKGQRAFVLVSDGALKELSNLMATSD